MLPGHPKSALKIHLQPPVLFGVQGKEQAEQHPSMEPWLLQGRQRGMVQERSKIQELLLGQDQGKRDDLLPGVQKCLPAC